MNGSNQSNAVATKQDINNLGATITTLINQNVDDLSSAISSLASSVESGFIQVNHRLEDLEAGQNRIESKLDPTIEQVDDLQVRVSALEQKTT